MNRHTIKGFLLGLAAAALVTALTGAAYGLYSATRTIEITDGVTVTVNGVPFIPRDAAGAEVPVILYNGTTYVPARAFSGIAGLGIEYDAGAKTVRVETPDYTAAADPRSGSYIGREMALQIALSDAGVREQDARILKAHLDYDWKQVKYDVEFCAGWNEYDYEIDALTGAILERELDLRDFDWTHHDDHHTDHGFHMHTGERLTPERAKEIALERLPDATVRKCELDEEHGLCVYEIELRQGRMEYECEIDAVTGEILKWERD